MKKLAGQDPPGKAGRARKGGSPGSRRPGRAGSAARSRSRAVVQAAGAAFPASRSSIIPMLQSAQAAFGYLPRDAMRAIARHLAVPPALVEGVASFYAQFRFEKPGRHRVTVCRGTACYVRGSGKLMEDLQADLAGRAGRDHGRRASSRSSPSPASAPARSRRSWSSTTRSCGSRPGHRSRKSIRIFPPARKKGNAHACPPRSAEDDQARYPCRPRTRCARS